MATRSLRTATLVIVAAVGILSALIRLPAPTRAQVPGDITQSKARAVAAPVATQFVNGGFESGPAVGWTEYSLLDQPIIVDDKTLKGSTDVTAHSGSWLAWLGGTEDADEVSYIKQQVTIDAAAPVLAYWHYVQSIDVCGWDWARVLVNGAEVTKFSLCMNTNTGAWVRRTADLSAYIGQTVWVQFQANTNQYNWSSWFIDDVTLEAGAGPTSTPTATGTATATGSPTATASPTGTATPSRTPTASPTATASHTPTSTSAVTGTSTTTPTASRTPTSAATSSRTPTASPTGTNTPTASPTPTPTLTVTPSTGPVRRVYLPLSLRS
jgi:hypothetical protein